MNYIKIAKELYLGVTQHPAWRRMTLRQKTQIRLELVKIWTRAQLRYWKFRRDFYRQYRRLKRAKLSTKN